MYNIYIIKYIDKKNVFKKNEITKTEYPVFKYLWMEYNKETSVTSFLKNPDNSSS